MLAIINNDKAHAIPIAEGVYDYMAQTFHLKNCDPEEQTPEMMKNLLSFRGKTITSLEIQRKNHDFIDEYKDLNAHIVNINKLIRYSNETDEEEVITVLNIDILNEA